MKKQILRRALSILPSIAAMAAGAADSTLMAAASVPDEGDITDTSDSDGATVASSGVSVDGLGRDNNGLYMSDVDRRIVRIRPMATPLDQISRYAKPRGCDSFDIKYYSVGSRPISCPTSKAIARQTSGASVALPVDDPNLFTLDDTIRVVGVKGICDEKGIRYDSASDETPDLMLCVCGKDPQTNVPTVYAVNGEWDSATKQAIFLPAIPAGTVLVRMGKACGELDVQTGRFNNVPMPEVQYCQNFMIQVEQSTFDKIAAKEADWGFSDLEEDGIYDMRLAMENTYLFGVRRLVNHVSKNGMNTWFTGGIWWMAGKDIEVGEWDNQKGCAVITDDNLVDITKDLFVGTGIGNKRKILFCGSDMLSAFSKIKSDKFRLKESVEVWNLKFKSWDTDFGEVLTIHHELFDVNGMSDCGLALDPSYLSKRTHVSWARNILDLKKAGVRNTDAVVLQEVSCLYLRYAKAHARMRLAQAPAATE